jgi:hypothetical protein
MTRFVVDASAVLHLGARGSRSQASTSSLHRRSCGPRRCPLCTRPSSGARSWPTSRATTSPASGGCRSGSWATRAPASGLGRGRSVGPGLDLQRRVRCTHSAAGRRVRHSGRGTGSQRRRDRRDRVDSRPALGAVRRPTLRVIGPLDLRELSHLSELSGRVIARYGLDRAAG